MKTTNKQTNSHWKGKIIAFVFGIVIVTGITSVFANFPPLPSGVTSFGGWLGEVFDLNNSGSGQLALNSKKIVLPADSSVISENKQVPTKEYVDSRVSANSTASDSNVSGGGGAFTLVGKISNVSHESTYGLPSCPNGYSSAMNGYWNCGSVPSQSNGMGCFCGESVSYDGGGHWASASNTIRCVICVPGSDSKEYLYSSDIPSNSTVLWITEDKFDGNLGGRAGADQKCRDDDRPDYLKSSCKTENIHAFLSVDTSDEVRDAPNCDLDLDKKMKSFYDCHTPIYWYIEPYNAFSTMAENWIDLKEKGMQAYPYADRGFEYWSGTKSDFSLEIPTDSQIFQNACKGWTSNVYSSSGYFYWDYAGKGNKNSLDGGGRVDCRGPSKLLCGCKID